MMIFFPLESSWTSHFERTWNLPLPVEYMSTMPSIPWMVAPVGKSGPFTCCMYSSREMFGTPFLSTPSSRIVSTCNLIAPATSVRLWGGILVAIPTAIPSLPFKSRFGNLAGSTVGSISESSKFGWKSTIFFSMSPSMCFEILSSLLSVYLIAAGGSPSIEPKFPCPSTSGYLSEKS